jgi:coproporphyrinogen III oxidase-like Fe-S oxidoreductase
MTALRTKWGVHARHLEGWGKSTRIWFEKTAQVFVQQGLMNYQNEVYILTAKGKIVSDAIIADLFL